MLPVHHLRQVLQRVSDSAPASGRGRFLVLTHRGPDPDALGAAEGLRRLLAHGFGFEPVVATLGRIHRAENLALVRTLDLDLSEYGDIDPAAFAGATLVDTQPEFGHTVLPEGIPVVAVFDHHVPPKVQNGRRSGSDIQHRDVRLNLGATSSMIYEYLRDAGIEMDERTASALFCGVRYDTADLSRNASPLDEEAYYETFRRANRHAIAQIHHPPLPREYFTELHRALSVARQHGPLVLALLGKVENPESVAEMADFFLRLKGSSFVVVAVRRLRERVRPVPTHRRAPLASAYPLMARHLGRHAGHSVATAASPVRRHRA